MAQDMITLRNKKTGQVIQVPRSQYVASSGNSDDQQGLSGIGSDVASSLATAPDALLNMVSSIPGGAKNVYNYAKSNNPLETLGNAGAGIVESGAQLLSAPQVMARYLSKKFPKVGEFLARGNAPDSQGINDPTIYESLMNFEKEHGLAARSPEEESVRSLGGLVGGGKVLSKIASPAARVGTLAAQQTGAGGDPLHAAILGMLGEGAAKIPYGKAPAAAMNTVKAIPDAVKAIPEMAGKTAASVLETTADYGSKIPMGAEVLQPTMGALASYLKHISVPPEEMAQRKLFGDLTSEDLPKIKDRMAAAQRLGLSFLTPGEALLSPFQTAKEANIGRTNAGAKLLYEKGKQRVGTEGTAINNLLDTIYNPDELGQQKTDAYQQTMGQKLPDTFIEKWKQNPIVDWAVNQMQTKPTYKSALQGIDPTSFEYWNIVKRVIGDLEKGEAKGMQGFSSNAATKVRNNMVNDMDAIQPQYENARNIAEREFTRKDLENVFDKKTMTLNNFWSFLKSDKAFNKVMQKLEPFPDAKQKLTDIRSLSNEIIPFDESIRSSYKLEKTGMNKDRNKLDALKRDLDNRFGQEHDVAAVNLMTDPQWISKLSEYLKAKGK